MIKMRFPALSVNILLLFGFLSISKAAPQFAVEQYLLDDDITNSTDLQHVSANPVHNTTVSRSQTTKNMPRTSITISSTVDKTGALASMTTDPSTIAPATRPASIRLSTASVPTARLAESTSGSMTSGPFVIQTTDRSSTIADRTTTIQDGSTSESMASGTPTTAHGSSQTITRSSSRAHGTTTVSSHVSSGVAFVTTVLAATAKSISQTPVRMTSTPTLTLDTRQTTETEADTTAVIHIKRTTGVPSSSTITTHRTTTRAVTSEITMPYISRTTNKPISRIPISPTSYLLTSFPETSTTEPTPQKTPTTTLTSITSRYTRGITTQAKTTQAVSRTTVRMSTTPTVTRDTRQTSATKDTTSMVQDTSITLETKRTTETKTDTTSMVRGTSTTKTAATPIATNEYTSTPAKPILLTLSPITDRITAQPNTTVKRTTLPLTSTPNPTTLRELTTERLTTKPRTTTRTTTMTTQTTTHSPWKRTVIFFYRRTDVGQDLFIRGGVEHSRRSGCTRKVASNPCGIPIRHRVSSYGAHFRKYNAWNQGDTRLDWYGGEDRQGYYMGDAAFGTPSIWTTNQYGMAGSNRLNRYGAHHWYLDVDMDCSASDNGWFGVKGFLDTWESNIKTYRGRSCSGSAGGRVPYASINHVARCGYINVIRWGSNGCYIDHF